MSNPRALAELIEAADRNRWCTRVACTTCGSGPFRAALSKISQEDVIGGLRSLSRGFLASNPDAFRLIIAERSLLGVGTDLVEALEGTPAGEQLLADLDYRRRKYERRQAHWASQAPETIAQRRAERKAAKALLTEPQRQRKRASREAVHAARQALDALPVDGILEGVVARDSGVPLRAIGGLVYRRLLEHYRAAPIQPRELELLSELAERHSGHWKKLLGRIGS